MLTRDIRCKGLSSIGHRELRLLSRRVGLLSQTQVRSRKSSARFRWGCGAAKSSHCIHTSPTFHLRLIQNNLHHHRMPDIQDWDPLLSTDGILTYCRISYISLCSFHPRASSSGYTNPDRSKDNNSTTSDFTKLSHVSDVVKGCTV
jgi:hypothetical protein